MTAVPGAATRSPRHRAARGLGTRLFAAQTLVVLTGAVTLALVATAIGPTIFHDHLQQVSGHVDPTTADHVERAYASASAVSLAVALLAALVAALAVSAYVARRVAQPVGQLAAAAADVAVGRYTVSVPEPRLGTEFSTVAAAFNAMAAQLASVEATRRRLLADLGHELRTPIATIEAYIDAAEDGVNVTDEDTWSVLRTQTGRLRRLTDDIAAVSRAEEGRLDLDLDRHPVAVADVVAAALAAGRPRYLAKGVLLQQQLADPLPPVNADRDRLAQVLGNLLENSLRHTPPGGLVTVRTDRHEDSVSVSVVDTGEGIDPAHLPHLFERFYRADAARDREHGGSGIGLAIARSIVVEHGGRITASSEGPGRGATFTVILPIASDDRSGTNARHGAAGQLHLR